MRYAATLLLALSLAGCAAAPPAPSALLAPSETASEPAPSPTTTATTRAIILVGGFFSPLNDLASKDLAQIGRDDGLISELLVLESERQAIARALGLPVTALRGVEDQATLRAELLADPRRVAALPAERIEPALHEISWQGMQLTGVARIRSLADWPLQAELPFAAGEVPYDPSAAWTLVAAGDLLLDRGVAYRIRQENGDSDYPFDGGSARVTGIGCCGRFGGRVARTERAGEAGSVRALLTGADLTIANLESPTPIKWVYHNSGTRFTGNPALLEGVARSGIDWLSLANNHIGDGGPTGILQTIGALEANGLGYGGAGRDLAAASQPWLRKVGGITIAIISVDAVASYYHATSKRPGSAPFTKGAIVRSVLEARAAGADYVIVFPHWGVEFQARPTAAQRRLAEAAISAGADLILGGHSHWASGVELTGGKPVFYGMGNFVFDQNWSVETAQGLIIELTFLGARLIAIRLHPTEILEQAQPNLLVGEWRDRVLRRMEGGSRGLAGW